MREAYELHPRRPRHSPAETRLTLIRGEVTAERFIGCDKYLKSEGARTFFRSGRLSLTFNTHLGVAKRALREIPLDSDELERYKPWSQLGNGQLLELGNKSELPSLEKLELLRTKGDPILHIIDHLEEIRLQEYPDIERDVDSINKVRQAYGIILSSTHGTPL